jgi:hypothetical protein
VQPTEPAEPIGHRFLDSFAELCDCRNTQLEGLYLGQWYRVTVTGFIDGAGPSAGAHLVYLDSEDTEVLGPADFEAGSWRVRGGSEVSEGDAAGSSLDVQRPAFFSQPVVSRLGQGRAPRDNKNGNNDTSWEAKLTQLVAYKAEHGDCNVLKRWAEVPGLGGWVTNQRQCKRKFDRGEPSQGMTAERAARLTTLGFVWDPPKTGGIPKKVAWEAQLARLAAYKVEHGDCNVPNRWAEDPRLGKWVQHQRNNKRKIDHGEPGVGMTVERAARLAALGLVWDPKEAEWEAHLVRLAGYKAAHGHCNVPHGWAEEPRLSKWVSNQRERKRKLDRGEPSQGMTAERAARLTALGLVWNLVINRFGQEEVGQEDGVSSETQAAAVGGQHNGGGAEGQPATYVCPHMRAVVRGVPEYVFAPHCTALE